MKSIKLSTRAKHAILIGGLCSVSYLAVYIARNMLSAVTPQMIEEGFTEANIGAISSVYFITYAFGQLINGAIGDRVKARYMISLGLLLAGITNILFSMFASSQAAAISIYASTGFFLAMIYGPILVRQPAVNIMFMVLAIMASNGAATMLWSRYCPSLYDTGMVSSVTGFLDFLSYVAAAFANIVFANAVSDIGWDNLIIVWMLITGVGIIVALPYKKMLKKSTSPEEW